MFGFMNRFWTVQQSKDCDLVSILKCLYVLITIVYLVGSCQTFFIWQHQNHLNDQQKHLDELSNKVDKLYKTIDELIFVSRPTFQSSIRSVTPPPSSTERAQQPSLRSKRDLQNIYRWIDDQIEANQTEHQTTNIRHVRNSGNKINNENKDQDAVDFFIDAQPTDQPASPGFTWLTSYSRIPFKVLNEYCTSLRKVCLRGEPGPPGLKGSKGDQGLDGIDGLPGEPGLEGTPGRDGVDGKPGLPGLPGKSGLNGIPGKNGSDGERGQKGEPGINGNPGPAGPRGKRGPAGQDGKPGITVQAWHHKNDTLLIAPSIEGIVPATQTITVKENEQLRFICTASGQPIPKISWRRDDDRAILLNGMYHNLIESSQLNISRVSRDNFGPYKCIATNGIPPAASKRINLLVTFPPLVKILVPKQMIGAAKNSWVILECYIEAYPEPFVDWIYGDAQVLVEGSKYNKTEEILDSRMGHSISRRVILNITNIQSNDFGLYKCLARNQLGLTYGIITLYESDTKSVASTSATSSSTSDALEPTFVVYGESPKPMVTKVQCEPCPTCPPSSVANNIYSSLTNQQCKEGQRPAIVNMGVSVLFNHSSWKQLSKRNSECYLNQIGKPVFYSEYKSDEIGCWMRDPNPIKPGDEEKYWLTRMQYNQLLEEYDSKENFRNKIITKNYTLLHRFSGNAQAINAGVFYYGEEGTHKLIMFHLDSGESAFINLEANINNLRPLYGHQHHHHHHHQSPTPSNKKTPRHVRNHNHHRYRRWHDNDPLDEANVENAGGGAAKDSNEKELLYTTQLNHMDIAADENGIWVVYPNIYSELNNTIVMKFNGTSIEFIWNLTIDYHRLGETFIMCGILYGIDSVQQLNTHIAFAYDLYENIELKHLEQIQFTNPFMATQYVGYNAKHQTLYTWDKSSTLEYLLKIDQNRSDNKQQQHQQDITETNGNNIDDSPNDD